jgi:hypothetical protein
MSDSYRGNGEGHRTVYRRARRDHLILPVSGLFAALTLIMCRLLDPSKSGIGTHHQLGLGACPFLLMTGFPCPICGITTSLSLAVHGQFISAVVVQPFGALLFGIGLFLVLLTPFTIRYRVDGLRFLRSRYGIKFVYTLLVFLILSWIYKIASYKSNLFN